MAKKEQKQSPIKLVLYSGWGAFIGYSGWLWTEGEKEFRPLLGDHGIISHLNDPLFVMLSAFLVMATLTVISDIMIKYTIEWVSADDEAAVETMFQDLNQESGFWDRFWGESSIWLVIAPSASFIMFSEEYLFIGESPPDSMGVLFRTVFMTIFSVLLGILFSFAKDQNNTDEESTDQDSETEKPARSF